MITNTNFPAALSVLAFLGTTALLLSLLLISAYASATRRNWTRWPFTAAIVLALAYIAVLLGFSSVSQDRLLSPGQEKYFCEIDCHLAYSVAGVQSVPNANTPADTSSQRANKTVVVILRTRFDEATVSPHRLKNAPLAPNPRDIILLDSRGQRFAPSSPPIASASERALTDELRPGESYLTPVSFSVPSDAEGLRLLVTSAGGPEFLMIGGENSIAHKKAFFLIEPKSP